MATKVFDCADVQPFSVANILIILYLNEFCNIFCHIPANFFENIENRAVFIPFMQFILQIFQFHSENPAS